MTTHIRMWFIASDWQNRSGMIEKQVRSFEQLHPSVTVELRRIPWPRGWTSIAQAIKEGDLPDVFQMGTTWVSTLAHLGLLTPVPKGLATKPAIVPWVDKIATHSGKQLVVPWTVECSLCAVRIKSLEQAGLSLDDLSDWDGFLESCYRLAEADKRNGRIAAPLIVPCRPEYGTLHWTTHWLFSGGFNFPDLAETPLSILTQKAAAPGLNHIASVYHSSPHLIELVNASPEQLEDRFLREGRFAMYLGPSDTIFPMIADEENHNSPFGPLHVLPIPKGPAGSITRGGGTMLGVSCTSRHPEIAWELIRFLTTDPLISQMAQASLTLPATDCEFWQERAHFPLRQLTHDILQTSLTYPQHPLWRSVESALMHGLSAIYWFFLQGKPFGDESMKVAEEVDRRINALLQLGWDNQLPFEHNFDADGDEKGQTKSA